MAELSCLHVHRKSDGSSLKHSIDISFAIWWYFVPICHCWRMALMVVLSSTALYLLESRTWILSALASYGQLLKSSAIDPTDTAGPTFPVARLHVKIDWFCRGMWLRATRCAISRVAKVFSTQSGFARSPWRQWVTHLVGRARWP